MCLLLFAYRVHPDFPLVVAANRDEFHSRPTAPADWWSDRAILAGRDLEAGGTWTGVNRFGRFAAVTNYRDPASQRPGRRSRGDLVLRALDVAAEPASLLQRLRADSSSYNGFNLIFGDAGGLFSHESRGRSATLPPGLYGLSNHLLESPWPKVRRGKAALQRYLDEERIPALEPLFELLSDRTVAPDSELPNTGVSPEWERRLAPMFIVSPEYGTRASTVMLARHDGEICFAERGFDANGDIADTREFRFRAGT